MHDFDGCRPYAKPGLIVPRGDKQKRGFRPRFVFASLYFSLNVLQTPQVDSQADIHWRIPSGQRLLFEDFDDGIVVFDALVGSTHLLNVTAAETLAIIEAEPGLAAQAIHARLLARLDVGADSLALAAVDELLWRLEDLNLIAGFIE